ncbi:MAG: RND family transporter [Thermoplasmata archaeon]|nr:RND family transporter [Thermoplasmata archaeon]
MGFDVFLSWIARGVTSRPKTIILGVLLITVLAALPLQNIIIETDVSAFFPDNDIVEANERLEGYFGRDAYIHAIYVEAAGAEGNVLSPKALRDQYNITTAASSVEGVVGVQGMAGVVNEMCHYIFDPLSFSYRYNESRTLLNTPDEQIAARVSLLQDLVSGEMDPGQFTGGDMDLDPDDLRFFFGLLMSKDFDMENFTASATLILVELDGNLTRSELRGVVGEVKDSVSAASLHVVSERETSEYYIAHEMEETIRPTMAILGIGILVIITLILWGSFRHMSYVWAPMLTLIIAIIWTFSLATLMGFVISILDVAVVPLIVGLGVDYTVHLSRRYQEGLFQGMDMSASIGTSIRRVGAALFLAFVTTVVAFLSNVVSDVPPIREFGILCALGIGFSFILALTFYTSIRLVVDRRRGAEGAAPRATPTIDRVMGYAADLVEERPVFIAVATVLLVAGGFYGATLVPVEFDLQEFLPHDWESVSTNDLIRENFLIGTYSTVYVLVEGEDLANPHFLESVYRLEDNARDDSRVVYVEDSVTGERDYFITGPGSLVEKAVERNSTLAVVYHLDERGRPTNTTTAADVRGLFDYLSENRTAYDTLKGQTYSQAMGKMLYRDPATDRYTAAVVRIQVVAVNDADNRLITRETWEDIEGAWEGLPPQAGTPHLTGGVVVVQTIIDQLSVSQIESTIISVVFALLVLVVIYRSLVLGLVSLIPVFVTIALSLGTMWLLGISLNALTIMITALTIGLGVDYAIHVVERFREEEAKHPPSRALHNTLENTGAALFISALTTIFGFGILVIAGIPIFSDFGIITAAMIAYSILAAVLVTPVVLMAMARKKMKQKRTGGEKT